MLYSADLRRLGSMFAFLFVSSISAHADAQGTRLVLSLSGEVGAAYVRDAYWYGAFSDPTRGPFDTTGGGIVQVASRWAPTGGVRASLGASLGGHVALLGQLRVAAHSNIDGSFGISDRRISVSAGPALRWLPSPGRVGPMFTVHGGVAVGPTRFLGFSVGGDFGLAIPTRGAAMIGVGIGLTYLGTRRSEDADHGRYDYDARVATPALVVEVIQRCGDGGCVRHRERSPSARRPAVRAMGPSR